MCRHLFWFFQHFSSFSLPHLFLWLLRFFYISPPACFFLCLCLPACVSLFAFIKYVYLFVSALVFVSLGLTDHFSLHFRCCLLSSFLLPLHVCFCSNARPCISLCAKVSFSSVHLCTSDFAHFPVCVPVSRLSFANMCCRLLQSLRIVY